MAPVGIRYRSNTYQNIGCKFNKGCIIFLICKNNRLKLQYPCIHRYQSYHHHHHYHHYHHHHHTFNTTTNTTLDMTTIITNLDCELSTTTTTCTYYISCLFSNIMLVPHLPCNTVDLGLHFGIPNLHNLISLFLYEQ